MMLNHKTEFKGVMFAMVLLKCKCQKCGRYMYYSSDVTTEDYTRKYTLKHDKILESFK
jgi:uncharacterized OB-fold protein